MWVMSCGEAVSGCSTPTAALKEAGEAIGWKVNVCDGQLNPTGFATCIRQAVSAKAEVLIPVGVDCTTSQQAFMEAKQAGVLIVGGGGANNCAGDSPWASERLQLEGKTLKEFWEATGKLQADYIIGKTDGKAKTLVLNFTDQVWGGWITEGFKKELETCAECEVVATLDMTNNDIISNTAAQKFSSALLGAPSANSVIVPNDGWLTGGLAAAVKQSGRDLVVIGRGGEAPNMNLISTNGGQTATVGYAAQWGAWGSVDTAARMLDGQKAPYQGDGIQVVDADHNMPESGKDFQGPLDFRAKYLAAWGK
ncbi:sugar ABC transporter substrate-binding protein [Pseudarthrobacter oxydans]|uniref:sugar ABC transporter substrate-binding protein n=1 Tax=Pseudarthrobacter oxydans TaxID=1671 RepID=UPI0037F142AC